MTGGGALSERPFTAAMIVSMRGAQCRLYHWQNDCVQLVDWQFCCCSPCLRCWSNVWWRLPRRMPMNHALHIGWRINCTNIGWACWMVFVVWTEHDIMEQVYCKWGPLLEDLELWNWGGDWPFAIWFWTKFIYELEMGGGCTILLMWKVIRFGGLFLVRLLVNLVDEASN